MFTTTHEMAAKMSDSVPYKSSDLAHIHAEWHRAASSRDTPALVKLYAEDAVLESPLVPAILVEKTASSLN